MKRRLLSLLLAAVMLLGTFAVSLPVAAKLNFSDTDGHWGEEAIEYVVENGLMNGVGDGTSFAPNMSLTRGMVVTVLYRDNGSPETDFKGTFLDVSGNMYYSLAVEWAYANGIVNGTGTDEWGEPYFSPDRDITRQELATMFVRYAAFKHVDTTKKLADISTFPDASSVADWAKDAVKWAVGVNLITGKSNGGAATLSPEDKAVRAEFATIIKRFKEADFEYHLVYETPSYGKFTLPEYPLVDDADVYVAVDGNDKNEGTKDKPLATFEGAVAKVRELKKTAKDEIKVAFMAGKYGPLTLTLTAEDSGTKDIPITYCAYGDGDVTFTNGFDISASEFTAISDAEKYLFTDQFEASIKKVNISDRLEAGLDISKIYLFSETNICTIARFPNRTSQDAYLSNFFEKTAEDSVKILSLKERIDAYHTFEGVQLVGHFMYEWATANAPVISYDKTTGIFKLTGVSSYGISDSKAEIKLYINNVSEELDAKGEYWIDRDNGILYVYEPQGNYTLSTHGTFIENMHADYVRFVKLNFRCTTTKAIHIYANYVELKYCNIFGVAGDMGIRFDNAGVEGCVVEGCDFGFFAGVVCRIDGYMYECTSDNNKFINNAFHDFGIIYSNVDGLHVNNAYGTYIGHNEFYNAPRVAFNLRGTDCIIEYNVMHDVMQNSGDGGALYIGGTRLGRANIIRYNLFYDIKQGSGIFTIYLDDGMSDQVLYSNIFYNAGDYAVMIAGGRDNELYDNIVIATNGKRMGFWTFDKYYTMYQDGSISQAHFEFISSDYLYVRNLTDPEKLEFYKTRFPEMFTMILTFEDYDNPDCMIYPKNYYSKNYVFGAEHLITESGIKCSTLIDNKDGISLETNDYFVNPTLGDYSIKDGVDFADNHFSKIGRY